jgi:hypothetical protein
MSRDKGRLAPFVPLDQEVMRSPAWRAASMGARILYIHLKRRWSFKQKNNGRIFLSLRDAQEEMGVICRDSISRWFRELQHYGFIVMTHAGGLGVNGKGKAPHWRLTELEAPGGRNGNTWMLPTKDFNRWDGTKFRDDRGAVERARARVAWNRGPEARPNLMTEYAGTGTRRYVLSDDPRAYQQYATITPSSLRFVVEPIPADEVVDDL